MLKRISTSFFFVVIFLLNACTQKPESIKFAGKTMGTTYHITLANPPQNLDITQLQHMIDQRLLVINQLMSTYISDSEISRFNQSPSQQWFSLSPETMKVLLYSLSLSEKTQGKFDVTVAPLINLWGFGHKDMEIFPDDNAIQQAMETIGWELIEIDSTQQRAKKNKPLSIDLSAVAKGYGVDEISQLLDQFSIDHYLVEIGGEIRVKGLNQSNTLWRIGIETPSVHQSGAQKIIPLNNVAVATSGDYRNFFEKEGVRYSHTIDPQTGKPVIHNIASLTVISETAMEADALATALMVLGEEQALIMAKVYNIPLYILLYENNSFTALHSPAFEKYLQ